jgi:hypothetical protein
MMAQWVAGLHLSIRVLVGLWEENPAGGGENVPARAQSIWCGKGNEVLERSLQICQASPQGLRQLYSDELEEMNVAKLQQILDQTLH